MLENFNGIIVYDEKYEYEIERYDKEENLFICKKLLDDDCFGTEKINIFETGFIIDMINEDFEKIFDYLNTHDEVRLNIYSTQKDSGDNWSVVINKTENIADGFSGMKITTYFVNFCDEIKGEPLFFTKKYFSSNKEYKLNDEEYKDRKNTFIDWLYDNMNNLLCFNELFEKIITSEALYSKEEIEALNNMFLSKLDDMDKN